MRAFFNDFSSLKYLLKQRQMRMRVVAAVGEATWIYAVFKCVSNFLADDHAAQWHVSRVHALCKGDEIRCDIQ